jgi:hypothetical protein
MCGHLKKKSTFTWLQTWRNTIHFIFLSFPSVVSLFSFGLVQCPPSRVPQVDVTGYLYHDTVNSATATA